MYSAPATVATAQTVTVTATSAASSAAVATATITLEPPITVAVSPTTATVYGGGTQQFTATVANTTNTAVTWTISPATGAGTISSSGLFTAPATVATAQTVTVTATSAASSAAVATASLTLEPPVTVAVSPTTGTVYGGGTQQFTAAVANTTNTSVAWTINPATGAGTISSSGLYTAPATVATAQTVMVTATSLASSMAVATATVTLSPAVSVAVSPSSPTIYAGQTQQFTATVTNSSNTSVTWTISPTSGAGTISASGLYTAPATVTTTQTVTVTATSAASSAAVATASVTLEPPVTVAVSPTAATVYGGGTQQFTATVANSTNTSVAWTVSPATGAGTISSSGLYTAPATVATAQTVTVTVTSAASSAAVATATITLEPPITVTVSPNTVTVYGGGTQQFTAAVTNTTNTAVTWTISPATGAGTIGSSGIYTAPATVTTAQSVTVIATSAASGTVVGTATITLEPPLGVTLSPSTATVYGGGSQQFTSNQSVTWTITPATGAGTISTSGLYTAPAAITTQQTVTITATSAADTTQSTTATVTLVPALAVSPASVTLTGGGSQQFTANQSVTWTIAPATGAGTIGASGLYTAPASVTTQQTVTVTATSAVDATQSAQATVTLTPPPPVIASVTPGTAPVGLSQTITVTGTNTSFAQGQTTLDFGSSVAVSNVTVLGATQLTASILPALTAAPGLLSVTVTTNGSSVSLANALTITGPVITIASPANLSFVNTPTVTVSGKVGDPAAVVAVNGVETANVNGNFSYGVPLSEGNNTVAVTARSAGWATSVAVIQVNLDTTAPHLAIVSPPASTRTAETSITVAGMVNDIVVGTVNSQEAQVTVNGVAATVSNRSFSAVAPLSLGQNTIQAVAIDRVGNTATASVIVTRVASSQVHIVSGNNQTGAVMNPLPLPLVVRILNSSGAPAPNQPVVFTVAKNNGVVSAVAASGVGQTSVQVTSDANGKAQVYWTVGSHAGAGNNRVDVTSPGNLGWVYFTAIGVPLVPASIVVDSGLNQTGATGEVLPLPFIAVVVDAGKNRLPGVPVTFTVTGGGGTLSGTAAQLNSAAATVLSSARDGRPLRTPPATPKDSSSASNSITMVTDGDGRAAAFLQLGTVEGQGNEVVTATFDGNTGSPAVFMATGLVAGNPAQTSVTGVVLDNSNIPIPGVIMRLLALSQGTTGNVPVQVVPTVLTDSQGQFTIKQVPVGVFKLMADGTTATVTGKKFPTLEFDVTTVAGRATTVGMPIYLQSLDTVNQICVGPTTGGTLTLPAAPGFALTVAPGSATFPGGSLSGCISATPVNPDKVPMAPGFGQQPRFIVTIQPVGTTFNPPAALTLPNTEGLAPRTITEMYSYDHDLAAFVAIGTGTVSVDGSTIVSDPGVGVLKAGWHCGGDPSIVGVVADCPVCKWCVGELQCVTDPGQAGHSCNSNVCMQCVGGSCNPFSENPSPFSPGSATLQEPSVASTHDFQPLEYGWTQDEACVVTISARCDGASWRAVLVSLSGTYSEVYHLRGTLPNPTGQYPAAAESEVTGPGGNTTASNYCAQVVDLNDLGIISYGNTLVNGVYPQLTGFWNMVEAVKAHEDVHKTHLLPSLQAKAAAIEALFTALTVPAASGMTREQAVAQIQGLDEYTNAVKACRKPLWDAELLDEATPDHGADGSGGLSSPTGKAELAATRPMRTTICKYASSQSWSPCATCSDLR